MGDKNPDVIQEYWSNYQNGWYVADFSDNYYCEYTKKCSVYIIDCPGGLASVKGYYDVIVYIAEQEFMKH